MQSKTIRYIIYSLAAFTLLVGTFSGGVIVGWSMPQKPNLIQALPFRVPGIGGNVPTSQTTTNIETLFKPFWDTWTIVHNEYVDQPVNDETLMQGAIRGMLDSLGDEHTAYMDPDMYRQYNMPLQGEYEGIGAWVDITGDYLKIVAPMPDSPAEKAGLKAGDLVVAIDGQDMTGIDGNLVLRKILGPAGSVVKLTISRPPETRTIDISVERARISVPSTMSKLLDNNIAYIHLYTFGEKTTSELETALQDLMANKPAGLILDLRNNGGGFLNTAVEVVSQFIKGDQVVMYEQFGDGTRKTLKSQGGGLATDIPLVILVNEGTASASEITAGAVQDYGRGKLVGTTTYGKGSVQNWIPLANNEGAIRVSVARWLTPKDRQINKIGLKPDVEVSITEDDIKNGRDPQLDKAIELLTAKP
jgi:carboxyl-terminal processing protease